MISMNTYKEILKLILYIDLEDEDLDK